MIEKSKYHENLESLKKNINKFFEDAELDHRLILNSEERASEVISILHKIEEYFMDVNHGTIEPGEIFDKRQELLEEVREFLYS